MDFAIKTKPILNPTQSHSPPYFRHSSIQFCRAANRYRILVYQKTKKTATMKTLIFLVLFVLSCSINGICNVSNFSTSIANSKRLTGRIWDTYSRQPLANVTVSFYNSKDSTLVAGTISNSNGSFCIAAPDPGNCYLVISSADFEPQIISLTSIEEYQDYIRLGDIYLSKQTAQSLSSRKRMNN